jgi:CHAD domain-containing protein
MAEPARGQARLNPVSRFEWRGWTAAISVGGIDRMTASPATDSSQAEPPALQPGHPVGETLQAIAAHLLARAQDILEDRARDDKEVVHDIRRAMKRWRAFLKMLSPFLADQHQPLRADARALARTLTAARDAQSAIDAFHDTVEGTYHLPPTLTPQNLLAIYRKLDSLRLEKEAHIWDEETRQQFLDYIAAASYYVSHWALHPLAFDDLAGRLADTYRRARQALPADWAQATPEDLHELRRRVVEHRYQMELIEPAWPRLGRVWVDEAQRLRTRLGRCQDLHVLALLAHPHQPLAPWRAKLLPLIAHRHADYVRLAARLSARLFAEPPKVFRRRIAALWEAQEEEKCPRT